MSVRATKRLIGDTVKVTSLQNSPLMVVQSVNEEENTATTIWFSDTNESQVGTFPVNALDRAEHTAGKKPATKKPAAKKKTK
jgi:hypothetical protein